MGIGGSKSADDGKDRTLVAGRPDFARCDNMVTTSKYTVWSFLPLVRRIVYRVYVILKFLVSKKWLYRFDDNGPEIKLMIEQN